MRLSVIFAKKGKMLVKKCSKSLLRDFNYGKNAKLGAIVESFLRNRQNLDFCPEGVKSVQNLAKNGQNLALSEFSRYKNYVVF